MCKYSCKASVSFYFNQNWNILTYICEPPQCHFFLTNPVGKFWYIFVTSPCRCAKQVAYFWNSRNWVHLRRFCGFTQLTCLKLISYCMIELKNLNWGWTELARSLQALWILNCDTSPVYFLFRHTACDSREYTYVLNIKKLCRC